MQSSSSDAVVQQTNPAAALEAGQIGATAAQAASDYASQATSSAINEINQQYMYAQAALQPTETSGVQAQDQLNQYLGLSPYNPGSAPTAPVKATAASEDANVTQSQIQAYINENTSYQGMVGADGNTRYYPTYSGPSSSGQLGGTSVNGYDVNKGVFVGTGKGTAPTAGGAEFYSDPTVTGSAQEAVAQQMAQQANSTYDSQYAQYQQQLQNYNTNLGFYNQYQAQGPLTQAQITQNMINQPGFQAEEKQGTQMINQDAAAKGYLGSGQMLQELMNFGQNELAQYYGNTLNTLSGVANAGSAAAKTTATQDQNQGNAIASLQSQLGNTQANSVLAGANSLSQALIAASQEFNTVNTGSSSSVNGSGIGSLIGGLSAL